MKKLAIIGGIVALVPLSIFALRVYLAGHDIVLQERFPHLDPELVARANRELVKRSLRGDFADTDLTDEFLDAELIKLVNEYQNQ